MFFITMLCEDHSAEVGWKRRYDVTVPKVRNDFSEKIFDICFEKQEGFRRAQVRVTAHRQDDYVNAPVVEPYPDYTKCK